MKKPIALFMFTGGLFFVFQSFIFTPAAGPDFPAGVKEVLKSSCYDCHSNDASNKRATFSLNFDKWSDYKTTKKISKLDAICKVIEKDKMPPAKYLKGNPEKALSDVQKELICNWVEEESAKLMDEN